MSMTWTPAELLALATTFRVPDSALPPFCVWARDKTPCEHMGPSRWEVYYTGRGWAILDGKSVLGRDGRWEYQPLPSSRDDEFFRLYRWPTREVALEAACIAARLYPNGHPYGNTPPWGLHADWDRLWEECHAETERQVSAFAAGLEDTNERHD